MKLIKQTCSSVHNSGRARFDDERGCLLPKGARASSRAFTLRVAALLQSNVVRPVAQEPR
jgi:hypothetical protein